MKYSLLDIIMNKGKRIEGTTFIKEFEDSTKLVMAMEDLAGQIKATSVLDEIEQDIGFIKAGDFGEKNVHFELKNSFIPMLVLHNLVIRYDDYKAQLDFVLITNKFICILETKKLNGHITINAGGDFIRSLVNRQGKVYKREGMYSPISQNQRHVRILENLLVQEKVLRKTPVLSLVIMANPKSMIDCQYATKEIKSQIIKYDQLVPCIKRMMEQWKEVDLTPSNMMGIADFLSEHHVEDENAFITKYKKYLITEGMSLEADSAVTKEKRIPIPGTEVPPVKIIPIQVADVPSAKIIPVSIADVPSAKIISIPIAEAPPVKITPIQVAEVPPIKAVPRPMEGPSQTDESVTLGSTDTADKRALRDALSKFRLEQSRAENIKAFYIFTNAQMECLLERMPMSLETLMACGGFGPMKVQKYGAQILQILKGG